MIKKMTMIVSLVFFTMVSFAGAATLTFDDLEQSGPGAVVFPDYTDQGFKLDTNQSFGSWCQGNINYNNSASVFINYRNHIAKLSVIDGSLFTLESIDLDTIFTNNGSSSVEFKAYNVNGIEITTEGTEIFDGWNTYHFSTDFEDVSYVEWAQEDGYHQFDNIKLYKTEQYSSAVPIPNTCLLLSCGLIGLIKYRTYKIKRT